jgi:hypothetical protein
VKNTTFEEEVCGKLDETKVKKYYTIGIQAMQVP